MPLKGASDPGRVLARFSRPTRPRRNGVGARLGQFPGFGDQDPHTYERLQDIALALVCSVVFARSGKDATFVRGFLVGQPMLKNQQPTCVPLRRTLLFLTCNRKVMMDNRLPGGGPLRRGASTLVSWGPALVVVRRGRLSYMGGGQTDRCTLDGVCMEAYAYRYANRPDRPRLCPALPCVLRSTSRASSGEPPAL